MSDVPPEAWDDCFAPPSISVEVHCLHCGNEYDSYLIEWRPNESPRGPDDIPGFWCCPMPGCDGKGFCFDIFPVDPDWTDPETGERVWDDGCEDDCDCEECKALQAELDAEFGVDDESNELDPAGELQFACGAEDSFAGDGSIPLDDLMPESEDADAQALTERDLPWLHDLLVGPREEDERRSGDQDSSKPRPPRAHPPIDEEDIPF